MPKGVEHLIAQRAAEPALADAITSDAERR